MKFIFSISIIIISGVIFFTVVNPLYGDISNLRSEVDTYNVALDNSTELQRTRDGLVETYKNIKKEDRERLEHFLPNTVNNIKFILEIERIANIHSMPVKNIKFDPQRVQDAKGTTVNTMASSSGVVITPNDPSSSKPYGIFPVEFTTEGDYNTFVMMLKDIEQNLRLVDVKSVSFAVPEAKSLLPGVNPNLYTYNIRVETYWLK